MIALITKIFQILFIEKKILTKIFSLTKVIIIFKTLYSYMQRNRKKEIYVHFIYYPYKNVICMKYIFQYFFLKN